MKKKNKKYKGDSRQTMKGRAGSTRNGFVQSYSISRSPIITEKEVQNRDDLLNIDNNVCYWCKNNSMECLDHILPVCNTVNNIYSYTNKLCLFPSCSNCNSKVKGGKPWEKWKLVLLDKYKTVWSCEAVEILDCWINNNLKKLMFSQKDIGYINKQHDFINIVHNIGEYCAQTGKDFKEELFYATYCS